MTSIFIAQGGTKVVMPWRQDLAQLIPHARELVHGGQRLLVMPNAQAEAKICRNLGVDVPSPIITTFAWPGRRAPWEIQKITAALLVESPRAYVLSTMGTGKTASSIYAAEFRRMGQPKLKVLIVSTLSTMSVVWEKELFELVPQRKVNVLYGSKTKRLKLLAEDADYYIINHHGLRMLSDALIAKKFDVVILDELAVFRNKSTDLWKSANAVIERVPTAWGLTGSPTPMAPTDAFAQIKLLTPTRTVRSMAQFQDLTMKRISQFKLLPRPEANDIVFSAMQPSVRFTRDDVMELPPTTYVDRRVELDVEAQRAYKMLFDKMRTMSSAGKSITAANEGVLQNKLLQVACGYIYTDDKTIYSLPNTNRLRALEEVIDECDRKILVFVPYVHALEGVAAFLRGKKHSVATISGSTPRHRRDQIFTSFKTLPDPRIIVAHPQTMAHGLTLTEANTIIWYAPHPSLEIYEQANARVTRPGQTSKTLICHLSGTQVERVTYARLRTRAKMQGMLLDLFAEQELVF